MTTNLIITPIILPFFTALGLLLWRKSSRSRRVFAFASIALLLAFCLKIAFVSAQRGVQILKFGGWMPPFGIVLTVDLLSAIMLCTCAFIGFCAILYGFAEEDSIHENPLKLPLLNFLIAGINMSFSTGDLFNLYVSFEVMLISSYALMTLEANKNQTKHALPYITINLFGSAIFLMAATITYGLLGTLNYADIALKAPAHLGDPRLTIVALMFCVVAGIKAGMFPLYFWLPRSYPILSPTLVSFYGGMLTKVGVYVFIRLFATVFPHELVPVHYLVLGLSAATMFFGVLGAMSKDYIRSILSYHIISQVGYMLMALAFFTPVGVAASIFYVVHHIIVKSSLFLIGGVARMINRSENLNKMGWLWQRTPALGILFLIQALSLAGVPPLSGFWGKYLIMLEGLKLKAYFFVAVSIVTSLFTLISMLKIWNTAFWSQQRLTTVALDRKRWIPMTAVVALMAAVSLSIGLGAEWFMDVAQQAANMALDQQSYIRAVLEIK